MAKYEVGYIYERCYLQKRFDFSTDCYAMPLPQTGSSGDIHDIRRLLEAAHFPYARKDLERTLAQFSSTGQCTLLKFGNVEANSCIAAIESMEHTSENIIGSISVISANPAIKSCAFANGPNGSGLKFYIPQDRMIRHGTNVPGFLDALPDIEKKANIDPKFALLLKLFRASLREQEIDNQILFQLIILEESSDGEGGTFADRMRTFSERIGFLPDLEAIAAECGVQLPAGKDVIDLLVKLRNAAAHNGNITEVSLREYNGDWVVPLLSDKEKLHKLICEALRYMFCCLVGHTRDRMAMKISGTFEIRFD